jgi:hypothetical protein
LDVLLSPRRAATIVLFLVATATAAEDRDSDRHGLALDVNLDLSSVSSPLGSWTSGGLGKLRQARGDGLGTSRVSLDYRGRISNVLWARGVIDFVDDADRGADVVEAYLQWRPVPTSRNQHQWRFGAFYPPLSLENADTAWASPYTISFSAINTWLGEEIRPIGAEWSMRRRLGTPPSPHVIGAFASAFYGNDPAATLLFWRGWSLHDRQTRLNDRLPMPPFPSFGGGEPVPQTVEPIAEIDHDPGYYVGIEWSFAQQVRVQAAHYDNRAGVNDFSDGQWGWRTRFDHAGVQASLPARLGLIAQWMRGDTDWNAGALPDGTVAPWGRLVRDNFEAGFVLLTRTFQEDHRISARLDRFSITRAGATSIPTPDAGNAVTVAYRYTGFGRAVLAAEWLEIRSARDLWSEWYGLPRQQDERQLRVALRLAFDL